MRFVTVLYHYIMRAGCVSLALGRRFVNIEKNLGAKTKLDILDEQRRRRIDNSEMRDILDRAGALTASSRPTVTSSYAHHLRLPGVCEVAKIILIGNQVMKRLSDEKCTALLVFFRTACNSELSSGNHPSWGTLAR